jgi:hypothetical protein
MSDNPRNKGAQYIPSILAAIFGAAALVSTTLAIERGQAATRVIQVQTELKDFKVDQTRVNGEILTKIEGVRVLVEARMRDKVAQ